MAGVSELWTCYVQDYSILPGPGAQQARHVRPRYSSYSPPCRVSCVTLMGWGGVMCHVLCRSLRNTCSLSGDGALYCPILQNTASQMMLSHWCLHVTAWGRGLFQVNQTMPSNRIPSSYFPVDIRHSAPTLDLGRLHRMLHRLILWT